ncbi:MAG: hypothetical protein L0214_07495, partial [candidate division NC10 bacterium]|nr:hypothetical protein [candidate division NC10 bacterium]
MAKRLGPRRGLRGGVLGGRALVAQAMDSGVVLGRHAGPDGEANDIAFVPDLVAVLRDQVAAPLLWVADRQFGFPAVLARLAAGTDRFLVRHHGQVCFSRDTGRRVRTGTDPDGRSYHQEWGWLGGTQNPHRRSVRRLVLDVGKEHLVVGTDLVDPAGYPAVALLGGYRRRWGLAGVFQQSTAVFGLARLIGGTAAATVFQLSFCLVLYNLTQALRGYVSAAGDRPVTEGSGAKVFRDLTRELITWRTLLTVEETLACLGAVPTAAEAGGRLRELLNGLWREEWA